MAGNPPFQFSEQIEPSNEKTFLDHAATVALYTWQFTVVTVKFFFKTWLVLAKIALGIVLFIATAFGSIFD